MLEIDMLSSQWEIKQVLNVVTCMTFQSYKPSFEHFLICPFADNVGFDYP